MTYAWCCAIANMTYILFAQPKRPKKPKKKFKPRHQIKSTYMNKHFGPKEGSDETDETEETEEVSEG